MEETYTIDGRGRVWMTLPGKLYKPNRLIGRIVNDTFCCERQPNQVFRTGGGGIGFPYKLVKNGSFKKIRVTLHPSGRVLETSRESVLSFGVFISFKRNDLEKQIIMPIKDFGREPIPVIVPPIPKPVEPEPTLFDEVTA